MDPGFLLIENFARFAAVVGLILAAPLFVWGGYLWMTAMGDPNRSAAARNAVISVGIGMIVIGCAFIIPRVVGDFVVGPSGGVVFEREPGINCDGMFRQQLIINRTASTPRRMQFLAQRVGSQFDDCNEALWDPKVRGDGDDDGYHLSHLALDCYGADAHFIAGVKIPKGLDRGPYRPSRRDARNNIMVHFEPTRPPADGSICWMYISDLESWVEGYAD